LTLVLDASVAASWCLPDESSAQAERALDRIKDEGAITPAHWWFEVRNVLLVAERMRRIEARQARRFLVLLRDLDIAVDRSPDDQAIFDLARTHGLTFYDAAYLELAVRQGAMATLDGVLLKACSLEGVETW
jgi:predicted nucleic acid-binding protein